MLRPSAAYGTFRHSWVKWSRGSKAIS